MNKATEYRQCLLMKGEAARVTYVPIKFAIPGAILKLRVGDSWSDGWMVVELYHVSERDELNSRQDIKSHRRTTGDALPRVELDIT